VRRDQRGGPEEDRDKHWRIESKERQRANFGPSSPGGKQKNERRKADLAKERREKNAGFPEKGHEGHELRGVRPMWGRPLGEAT